jgi:glucose/arabinose dehydrogenase
MEKKYISKRPFWGLGGFLFTLLIIIGAKFPFEDTPVLSPAEEQKTFVLEKGLKIQLVAAEPMVEDPVVINFDEDGRMWVVEMRGYMPDIEGNNEKDKIGRISVLEDINGDGTMDKSTIYLDSLILPRAMALIKGGILVVENQALWECLDTNHDLKADTKTLIDKDYAGASAPEHSGNGLLRNLDNWYYNAKSRFRYKKIKDKWTRDSTEFRGQWGMTQDDKGRLMYNYNWSQLHGDLVPPNYLSRNKNHTPSSGIDAGLTTDRRVYPIRETPAVNRGYIPGTLDKKNKLLEFTAACSPLVLRENLLGKGYLGNVFVCEPTGNLVKRNLIQENGIDLLATDPGPGTEFLASTDERFRPVNLSSGPDGALYVVDMYKGIMQHVLYETPYLKDQYRKRGLDKFLHKGRIWRIVPENWQPKKAEKISQLNTEQLVARLSSSDGWQRDMAQKLLVEKGDKSVEKSLINLAKTSNNLGKLHAIYTLEGLNLLNSEKPLSLKIH